MSIDMVNRTTSIEPTTAAITISIAVATGTRYVTNIVKNGPIASNKLKLNANAKPVHIKGKTIKVCKRVKTKKLVPKATNLFLIALTKKRVTS